MRKENLFRKEMEQLAQTVRFRAISKSDQAIKAQELQKQQVIPPQFSILSIAEPRNGAFS